MSSILKDDYYMEFKIMVKTNTDNVTPGKTKQKALLKDVSPAVKRTFKKNGVTLLDVFVTA